MATNVALVITAVVVFGIVVWRMLAGPPPPALPVNGRQGVRAEEDRPRAIPVKEESDSRDRRVEEQLLRKEGGARGIVQEQPSHWSGALAPVSVLLVEDDEDSRQTLEYYGAHVVAVSSAAEALLETHHADVLLSDLRLPKQDGFALIQELRMRTDPALASIPAASITASRRIEDRHHALAAGYQVHMEEPVDPADLVSTALTLATMPRDDHGLRRSRQKLAASLWREHKARALAEAADRTKEFAAEDTRAQAIAIAAAEERTLTRMLNDEIVATYSKPS